jgi:drug/metabolite transporter (DMT)-like permease
MLGLLCALGFFCVWTGFIVYSRAGMLSGLTPFDVAALRFTVAGVLVLPFVVAWWPRHLPPVAMVVMALFGPGAIYAVLTFLGLSQSSAAYAGVFSNGSLPVFTMLLAYCFTRELPSRHQGIAVTILVVGAVLVGWQGIWQGGDNVATAIVLFLCASGVLSFYVFGVKHWRLAPREALALVTLPNTLVYLPLWYAYLPSGMADTDWQIILVQGIFQGLGPGFLAVIMFAIAATNLGTTPTAGFAAAVPASATLLAIPVLGEWPAGLEWVGIGVVTIGLVLLLIPPGRRV